MAKKTEAKPKAKKTSLSGNRDKYEYAFLLYMQCVPMKEIAIKVGVSANTVTRWKNENGWEVKRGSKELSMDALIAKTMGKASEMLDSDNFNADAFAKAVAQLKTLKRNEATVDDVINALTKFGDWLISESNTNKTITTEFVRQVTALQNEYILRRIKNG